MSPFRQELQVIPRAAWTIAFVVYLLLATGIAIALGVHSEVDHLPLVLRVLLPIFPPLLVFLPCAIFGYIYGDAKRRGMRYVMWTLLAMFIPTAMGIILYFLLREPLPKSCATCGSLVLAKFAFCPQCGTEVQRACPACRKPVDSTWSNCAHCGTKLGVAARNPA